jgi:hypothetical protein
MLCFDESRLYDLTEPFLEDLIKETSPEMPAEVLQTTRLVDTEAGDLIVQDLEEDVEDVRDTGASGASEASKAEDTGEISAPFQHLNQPRKSKATR